MNDLLESGVRREIVHVVAAIREATDRAFDITELGRPDDDAFETPIDNGSARIPPLGQLVELISFDGPGSFDFHGTSPRRHQAFAPPLVENPAAMNALDLTKRPPRSPRELLPGLDLLMAARTVDKMRVTLPGGNIGSYQITGFSSRLLERLGIVESLLREAVAGAASDAGDRAMDRRA